jgi:hypothetical protein
VLEVYNLFGTVTVIVPDGVEVVVRGGGLFASQKIQSPERPPVAGAPSLTIDIRGPGGTLHVRARPTPPDCEAVDQERQTIDQAVAQMSSHRTPRPSA